MKRMVSLVVSVVIAATTLQGCYGKMALTRKVYKINGQVQDKFVRSLVTWVFVIVPVYAVSALADFILFNTIEFWSGKNPVTEGTKDFKFASGDDTYAIHATKKGDTVSYLINHFRGTKHLDTMAIDWNTKSGASRTTLTQPGQVTKFAAVRTDHGVQVTKRVVGHATGMLPEVALYQP